MLTCGTFFYNLLHVKQNNYNRIFGKQNRYMRLKIITNLEKRQSGKHFSMVISAFISRFPTLLAIFCSPTYLQEESWFLANPSEG